MSLTRDLLASYTRPRQVIRRLLDRGENDAFAFGILMIACFVLFVSRWPSLAREAHLDPEIPLQALLGGALMGLVLIAPLMFYVIAGFSHLVAKIFHGKGNFYGARLSLFWSLLVVSPMVLLRGLVDGFIGAGPQATLMAGVLSLAFIYIWLACLIEAES